MIALFAQLHAETDFMLFEPGEAAPSAEEQARRIEQAAKSESGAMFLCEVENQLVGMCFGMRGFAKRTRHSLLIVVGILQAWIGQRIGRALLQNLEQWARSHGVSRLELTVRVDNERAIALYKALGFEREGVKRQSINLTGRYLDELYMAKLLT